ncbi:MAG: SRPBCC domain-containing protein [Bacteroidota bacterium]
MYKDLVITRSIEINADIATVWDALINPLIVKKYFYGTTVVSDWKPGSTIVYTGIWEGKPYADKGNVLAIEPEKSLKFNYWSNFSGIEDKIENYSVIDYEISTVNGMTRMTVTQTNITTEAMAQHAGTGWETVLENLKKLLEAE